MIFLHTEGTIYKVIGMSTLQPASGLTFFCADKTGRFYWIQPEKTKCAFFRGPVTELLNLIFLNPAGLSSAAVARDYDQQDTYRAVPNELWADKQDL